MNIFLTGATGFLGRRFLIRLLSLIGPEDRVSILLRREIDIEDERIIKLFGSLEGIDQFKDEILQCDYFFHLAADSTFGNKFAYDSVNYIPTVKIVDILKSSRNLKNFVFTSTIGAVDRGRCDDCRNPLTIDSAPNPTSLYGKSKLKAEEYIKKSGVPFTIIRPAWIYGKNMRKDSHINKFVSMVYKKSIIAKCHFPGEVSLIHVDDLSDALARCLHNGSIINKTFFAETEALSLGDIFKTIHKKIYNRDIAQLTVPRFQLVFGRIHGWLPLTVSNLFLNYLWAKDGNFQTDLGIANAKSFSENIDEVISTNINNGYWVITGANSGIGYALAKQLNKLNKKLILIDKDIKNLSPFGKHIIFKADLSNYSEIVDLVKKVNSYKIFCLINNAGVGFRGSLKDLNVEKIRETIDVNIRYPVFFTKLLLENLIWSGSIIVNIASSCSYHPLPFMSIYSASKSFLVNWSESLSIELVGSNRVITFSPSATYTNFQKSAGVKVAKDGKGLASPEYVAKKIIKAIYGKKDIIILGWKNNLLMFLLRLLPTRLGACLSGKLFEKFR